MALTAISFKNAQGVSTSIKITGISFASQTDRARLLSQAHAQQSVTTATDNSSQNNGGLLGGVGYLLEKTGVGFMSSVEGIWDYAAGGLAKLFGADDWAEQQFANDWFGDWYSHPEEWYNPSQGWQTAGDVAGGIGSSLPSIAAVVGAGAIAYASGGSLSTVSAGLISAGVSGLGAAGTSTKQAYRETGKLTGKEFGYGALSGVTEGAIEGVSTVVGMGAGQVSKSIAKSFAKETTKTVAKQGAVKTLAKGFIGEAFEEGMSEVLAPYWQRMTYNPDAQNASLQEVAYAAFVGGMSGLIMSGGSTAIDSGNSFLKGNNLVGRGLDAEVVGLSQQLADFEKTNATGDETFESIANTYAELSASLEATSGKVTTVTQKKLLGDLHRANTVAVFKPMIAKSAANIVNNAEVIAKRLNAYGYKSADGKPITFSADQIRKGVDPSNPKSFSKALKTNEVLRTLAVTDATGHLVMDTARFEEATLRGKRLASQVDLNRFMETATKSELDAVSQALGIEDWTTLDAETFDQKIATFVENGGVEKYAERRSATQAIRDIPADTARPMPKMVNLRQDGTIRYTDGDTQIAISKNGDAYTVYDYATDHLSKNMTRSEVNKLLRDYNTNKADITADAKANAEASTSLKQQAAEIDEFARKNIPDYAKLSAPNQMMIRKIIREGRAHGLSDADILKYASVAAHSGINIVFDKQATFRGLDKDGNEKYADGFYDPNTNRIVVNPDASRTHEKLLIHELDHAIRQFLGKDGVRHAKIFRQALDGVSPEVSKRIATAYKGVKSSVSKLELAMDETNAYYAEEVLSNRHTLEKLVEAEPTLKDKILSFFKGAAKDYEGVPELSKAAKKYYKTYKKLFDEFSERNFQNNATESSAKKAVTRTNHENVQVTDHEVRYSLIGRTEDGRGIYRSNYPKNTPKAQKQKDIINLVQNIWSKKPIKLNLVVDGKNVPIEANFNPELAERSDLAKIAFGNRKGTNSEKRITLDLSSDLYQIAEESHHVGSKIETGKENPAHFGVSEWHYFLTNLVFVEDDGTKIDCYMNIDVKQNGIGHWFYSFAIEKGTAPQTLLAGVTEESATVPSNSITDPDENVNTFDENSSDSKRFALPLDETSGENYRNLVKEITDENTVREGQGTLSSEDIGRLEKVFGADVVADPEDRLLYERAVKLANGIATETIPDNTPITVKVVNPKFYTKEMLRTVAANENIGYKTKFFVERMRLSDTLEYRVEGIADTDAKIAYVKASSPKESHSIIYKSGYTEKLAEFSAGESSVSAISRHERLHLLLNDWLYEYSTSKKVLDAADDLRTFIEAEDGKYVKTFDKINYWYQTHRTVEYYNFTDYAQEVACDLYAGALKVSDPAIQAKIDKLVGAIDDAIEGSNVDGVRYALCEFEDGQRFVDVKAEQSQFDGLSTKEKTALATKIIKSNFQGRVIGRENRAFVNGVTVDEYTHPSKHIDDDLYDAKMRASAELDNLMDAGFNFRTEADGLYGHKHPSAVGGFGYFDVIFRVAGEYYQGVINIENNRRGKRLKDVTKIRNITKDMASQYGDNPKYAFLRDASMDSISDPDEKVNRKSENSSEKNREASALDTDYMDAVNRGDMETAQKMVDEAAKKAGYTVKGYHGTGEDFNIFSEDKVGKRNVWGKGFYFGSSKGIADDYASWRASKGGKYRIVSAFLKFDNPFIPSKSSIGSAEEILDRWFPDMWKSSRDLGIGYIEGKLDGSMIDLLQFMAEHNNIEVRDVLSQYGFDGVKDGGELVVFSSEQIKSADPVTYDDNGNVIPLSERFNASNPDIRYALSNDPEKVTISKGALQKQKANYTSDTVYSKKDVVTALNGIEELKYLPAEIKNEFLNNIWNGLNSHVDRKNREKFVDVISKKLFHTLLIEARTEENYNKLQALKAERKKAAETLEGDARAQTLKELNKKIKDIEGNSSRLVDVYDQSQTNKLSDDIVLYLHKLLDSGKPSVKAKLQEEFDASSAGFWKAKYHEANNRNHTLGLLMSKAQQMKDLKLGTFANSTQHASEIFKNSIEQLARIQFRGNLNVSGTRKIIADLRQWYTSDDVKTGILEYVDANNTGLYVQGVVDMMETLSEGEKGFTHEDLKMLYDVMSYFTHFVENWGKVFRQGKWIEAKPEAERYINTLHANENIKDGIFNKLSGTTYMQTFGDPMSVARRMDKYESGFYTEMMLELRDAAVDAQVAEMEMRFAYEEFTKKHKKYVEKASVETVTYRGTEIPKMHLIGLYMTMKRKHAWAGLAANGFSFTDTKGKRVRVNGVVNPDAKITGAELEQITKGQLSAIEALLTDTDKEYIAILEQAYNVDARKLKADRDMQRLGFTNATDDYYYPIRRGNIAKNVDTSDIAGEIDRVSNSSFNKDTVRGAKQELFIESADAVFNRHIHAVCQYAYLSPAVEAYNRLYNLDVSENKNKPISVATESANTWNRGTQYFVKLISDIQGIPVASSEGMKALGFIRGSYAKFQLGANPKVWFTQLSSVFASSSLLDADSITRGMAVSAEGMDQYCSLAKLRNHDNTAAMAQGVLESRTKQAVGAVSRFSDLLMSPIGKMDRFVVGRLFGACQVQVEKNGGAKVGTEANKIEAGKLLRQVILETQQNSVATERSAAMRSGNEIVRTFTMFTSDSMKVVGRVIDSVGEVSALKTKLRASTDATTKAEIRQKLKAANRKARKSAGALCLTAVFMASIAQLFRWLYDKEQDEDESVSETMVVDAVGNLFGGLPLFKDAYGKIFEGYDVDNYAYSAVNDLLDSAIGLFEVAENLLTNEGSVQDRNRAMRNLAYSVGQMFGIPVRNVYNAFFGLTKRFNPEAAYVIDNAFYQKNYKNDLYKAIEEDDAEMTSFIMSLLLGERMNENVDEAVFKELLLLSKNGQKVIPRSVASSITINQQEYTISDAEQAAIKDFYATSEGSLKALFAKPKYNSLSDEQKAEAIDFVYDTYYNMALENALDVDRGNSGLLIADVVGVDNLALLYVLKKGLASDVDKNGKPVSGSKRKKVISAINSIGVSTEQKLLLICASGYALQDNDISRVSAESAKKRLLKYILNLKGATKEDKVALAEMCGFEVKNGRIVTKTTSQ